MYFHRYLHLMIELRTCNLVNTFKTSNVLLNNLIIWISSVAKGGVMMMWYCQIYLPNDDICY